MFTDDRDGFLTDRNASNNWPETMMEDYPTTLDRNLWFCPMATKTLEEGGQNPYRAWSEYDYVNGVLTYLAGSYGINLWISNEPWDVHEYWKSPNVKNAGYAPLLMDAQHNNLEPLAEDEPPPFETYLWTGGPADEIRRACIRRHHPFHINVLFLDYSMKRITLKELWILRWYVDWPQGRDHLPDWPDWMAGIPEP